MSETKDAKKPVIAYCDGCFDFLHYGHANQIRQASQVGDILIVGIHTDEEIAKHKSAPIFLQEERYHMLASLKWVDKIAYGVPFSPNVAFLDQNNCDFCVHGNDFSLTAEGNHTYGEVQTAGRYVERKRMPGVSTTDLIERLTIQSLYSLQYCSLLRILYLSNEDNNNSKLKDPEKTITLYGLNISPWTRGYPFMLTTELLKCFAEARNQEPNDKVVYVAGAFDVFHIGHLSFLEEAAKLGTFLLVGIHTDLAVKNSKGVQFPILTLHERVLNVLSYKCVSNVIIGAPYVITSELLDHFNVNIVCHGLNVSFDKGVDPYEVPKKLGKFRSIDSKCKVTTKDIFERVLSRRSDLEARNRNKETKERIAYNKVAVKVQS